jgi:hypothetical protein
MVLNIKVINSLIKGRERRKERSMRRQEKDDHHNAESCGVAVGDNDSNLL